MEEKVNNPEHYHPGTYEAIKVINAWGLGFCLGNVVKYLSRAGRKTGSSALEDLKKAAWYLNHEIQDMEEREMPDESQWPQKFFTSEGKFIIPFPTERPKL
jgi:hypothetical protein